MNSNGVLQKHWLNVTYHFLVDALLVCLALVIAIRFRFFGEVIDQQLIDKWPSIVLGSLFFPCVVYIFGLYAPNVLNDDPFKRVLVLSVCFVALIACMTGLFYLNFSGRIGRGIMLCGMPIAFILV